MTNIAAFDEFANERQIAAHQLGLPRIILEGRSDLVLFKDFWFQHRTEDFEFLEADDLGEGQGCTAVEKAVKASVDRDGIPAFGFVDRDRLFRSKEWELLFSTDDDAFVAGASTDELYTTILWEVEAYLLEPDLIPRLAQAHGSDGLRASSELVTRALEFALEECEHLLQVQRLYAAGHQCETSFPEKHFTNVAAGELGAACEEAVAKLPDGHATAVQIKDHIDRVLKQAPTEPADRLRFLLRYVDTKRYIHRLIKRLKLFPEIVGFLGTAMLQANRRPHELDRQLDRISERLDC